MAFQGGLAVQAEFRAAQTAMWVFISRLRLIALNSPSLHAAGAHSGGHKPHSIRVLACQASPEKPLRHGANVVFNGGRGESQVSHFLCGKIVLGTIDFGDQYFFP
jgi:hypothetical protein